MGTKKDIEMEIKKDSEIKTYRRRFAIAGSVLLLNISNAVIWVSYAPVATTAEKFYEVELAKVNAFSLAYLVITIPAIFLATYCYDKAGLRFGIYLGATLNGAGAIIKAIGTSKLIEDKDTQYAVSLLGQCLCATAEPFVFFVPTKISQQWFPEPERSLATTLIAMSNPLGVVLAQAAIPSIINNDEENIPLNNYIWMGFAVLCWVLILVCFTRSKPKTPPSISAGTTEVKTPYFTQLKMVFTNTSFLILFMTLGCGIALFSTISTVTQQVLCPLGYSDVFCGLTVASMVIVGFIGSGVIGYYSGRTKKFGQILKVSYGFGIISLIGLFEFFLVPNQEAFIVIFALLFGFIGVGAYPVGLELALEVTYPTEESIGTAFIFLSAQIQGFIYIVLVSALAKPQENSKAYLNACNGHILDTAKSYTIPLMTILSFGCFVICFMILFMKPKYKRLEAEKKGNLNLKPKLKV